MLKRKWNGSMTVEAAFVVPTVIFVIMALLYFCFYLHDKVKIEAITEKALEQGVTFTVQQRWLTRILKEKAVEEMLEQYVKEELERGFFFLEEEAVSCVANGFSIALNVKMQGKITLNPVREFWWEEPTFTLERSMPIHDPPELLRIYEAMGLEIGGIEGVSFIKSHIKELLDSMEE